MTAGRVSRARPTMCSRQVLLGESYAVSAFYERHLQALGHKVHTTVFNCLPLQRAWFREHGFGEPQSPDRPMQEILAAQVRAWRPEVVYIHEMFRFDECYLRDLRRHTRLIVGQIACPLKRASFRGFDLVLSSLPPYVQHFRSSGLKSERSCSASSIPFWTSSPRSGGSCRIGAYRRSGPGSRRYAMSSWSGRGTARFDLKLWGYEIENVPEHSAIRPQYQGKAWGMDAFRIMAGPRPPCAQYAHHGRGRRIC